jgi:hypothetical protein
MSTKVVDICKEVKKWLQQQPSVKQEITVGLVHPPESLGMQVFLNSYSQRGRGRTT